MTHPCGDAFPLCARHPMGDRSAPDRRVTVRPEYAELVAFGVGEYNPRLFTLTDVCSCRAERGAVDLACSRSSVGSRGAADSWWTSFVLGRHEQEARKAICNGTDLELVGVVVDDHPAKRLAPPAPEGAGSRASTIVCSHSSVTA